MTRRTVLQMPAAALAQMPAAGRIKPRASNAIAASALSEGFETLDRKMFDPERTYPFLANLGVKWALPDGMGPHGNH
jgi:polysaccharide biosynthesis protein PslG